jgi:hypothetical protein
MARVLSILVALRQAMPNGIPLAALSEYHGVSIRTLWRDVQLIRHVGFRLHITSGYDARGDVVAPFATLVDASGDWMPVLSMSRKLTLVPATAEVFPRAHPNLKRYA